MSSYPIVVRAFVFNPEWQILLARHKSNTPWVLPGGHLEGSESIHETIIRELHEEFGIMARFFEMDREEILHHKGKKLTHLPLPISIYNLEYKNAEWKDKSRMEYVFLMETDDIIKSTQAEEIAEFKWFEVDDILMMKPNIEAFDFMIEMLEKIVGEDEEE
jgi:8-oxo-dGTP pyrophosphatase MutT (NUDIX family)